MSRLSPGLFSPKCGVPSGAILFPFKTFIERCNKNNSGLSEMIRMGKPICHTYVGKYNRVTSLFSGRSR